MSGDMYTGGMQLPGGPFVALHSQEGDMHILMTQEHDSGHMSLLFDLSPEDLDGWIDRMMEFKGALVEMREACRVANTWRAS